LFANL
jgi:hypothetical protein